MARYVDMLDLARMKPADSLSSTTYCLADPGRAYIVYRLGALPDAAPEEAPFGLDVQAGNYEFEWFDPETNRIVQTGEVSLDNGRATFTADHKGQIVLFLKRR